MRKFICNIGDVFGQWAVIDNNRITLNAKNRAYGFLCECSCKRTTKYVRVEQLKKGDSKCKKCHLDNVVLINKNIRTCELSMTYFTGIICGARYRNLEFNITLDYLYDLFIKQDNKCAISGIPIILDKSYGNVKRGCVIQTASLDRIDSTQGYIEGNVQWVHKDINRMKWELNQSYFIEICKKITEHNGH